MVTIEQKLTLFSKLLNQDIKEEVDKKFNALEKEYEKRIAENKFAVDKEANEIVEQARKRAEIKKVELLSKGKLNSKKEMMLMKEQTIIRFMSALEEKIKVFTTSNEYRGYLEKVIKGLRSLKDYENNLVIYLTKSDYESNKDFIQETLVKNGLKADKLSFDVTTEDILGGLVIKDPIFSTRIDESIRALLEEEKDQIIEQISLSIGEVGEEAHE